MKTRITAGLLAAGLFIALAVAPAPAQFQSTITIDIPFSFVVGYKTMPAGRYTLKPATDSGLRSRLLIRSEDGLSVATLATNLVQAGEIQKEAKLIFNRYGDQHFLFQVCIPATEYVRQLPQSEIEARLAAGSAEHKRVALVFRGREQAIKSRP